MINNNSVHYLRFLLSRELNALYISIVLRSLAFSLVGIFVPLYFYMELGYGLDSIILFYIVYSIFFGVFTFPCAKLVDKFSFKYNVLISSPFYILYFVMLYFLRDYSELFFLIPAVQGMVDALFWLAFHFEFSVISDAKKRGKEVGNWFNFSLLAGLVGPLIGGAILLFSGFSLLFLIVGILLVGSAVPMFFSNNKNLRFKFDYKNVFCKEYIKDGIAFFGSGGAGIVGAVFWPIFMYMILKEYLEIGGLVTIVGLITMMVTIAIAKLSDEYNREWIMRIGSIFHGIFWIARMFITGVIGLFSFYVLGSIGAVCADVPFSALTYDRSKRKAEYFVMREMYMSVGRIIILLLVLWVGTLKSSFLFASIFSLLYMFL